MMVRQVRSDLGLMFLLVALPLVCYGWAFPLLGVHDRGAAVFAVVWAESALVVFALLMHAAWRSHTETDDRCSAIDAELDERAARVNLRQSWTVAAEPLGVADVVDLASRRRDRSESSPADDGHVRVIWTSPVAASPRRLAVPSSGGQPTSLDASWPPENAS